MGVSHACLAVRARERLKWKAPKIVETFPIWCRLDPNSLEDWLWKPLWDERIIVEDSQGVRRFGDDRGRRNFTLVACAAWIFDLKLVGDQVLDDPTDTHTLSVGPDSQAFSEISP